LPSCRLRVHNNCDQNIKNCKNFAVDVFVGCDLTTVTVDFVLIKLFNFFFGFDVLPPALDRVGAKLQWVAFRIFSRRWL
jgi:hypothetical protein